MSKTYKLNAILEALAPLTHMSGSSGNESLINREAVLYDNRIAKIPVISGNAVRHKMVREPGALHLINACGLSGKLTIEQVNYLFNGGSLCESSTNSNIKKIADMQTILPLYRLVGGSLKNQVVEGSLLVSRGMLLCKENVERLKLFTGLDIPENLAPAEKFVDQYQYTRGDPEKRKDINVLVTEIEEKDKDKKSTMMIYNGQTVIAGSKFLLQFVLQNVSEIEVGALLQSLCYWQEGNSSIGGQSSRGHGKISLTFIDLPFDSDSYIEAYNSHLMQYKDAIVNWLWETFPNKKEGAIRA